MATGIPGHSLTVPPTPGPQLAAVSVTGVYFLTADAVPYTGFKVTPELPN